MYTNVQYLQQEGEGFSLRPKVLFMSLLSSNLRRLMVRAGLTQVEVAQRAGVDTRTIKLLLAGRSRQPHPRTLHKLARGLDVSADELLAPSGGRAEFDLSTNPVVAEFLRERPELCLGWTEGELAELCGHFGAGGALTHEGVEHMVARMNRKREILAQATLVLETDDAELLEDFVAMLYRRNRITPSSQSRPTRGFGRRDNTPESDRTSTENARRPVRAKRKRRALAIAESERVACDTRDG